MKTDRLTVLTTPLAATLALACAAAPPAAAGGTDELRTWEQVMAIVGPLYDDVLVAQAARPLDAMDLPRIADAARRAAAAIALGHGRLRDPRIPAFAGYARQTAGWLGQIANAARTGQRTAVRAWIEVGHDRYCEKCHEAVERAR